MEVAIKRPNTRLYILLLIFVIFVMWFLDQMGHNKEGFEVKVPLKEEYIEKG